MEQQIGTIYKITNIINGKVYIGQTKQGYLDRWCQHKSHARTGRSKHKLANAIRKYGEENFKVEAIEECPYEQLNEREVYWIKYYNSIKEGYNIKTGGQEYSLYYELENQQDIIDYYYQCHNQQQTCQHFNITDYKLRQLLTRNNLPTDRTNYGKYWRTPVKIVELDKVFESCTECARFLIDNNISQSKKVQCVKTTISRNMKAKRKVYGYTIINI